MEDFQGITAAIHRRLNRVLDLTVRSNNVFIPHNSLSINELQRGVEIFVTR